jgi:Predicted transcriptional regulators
VSSHLYIEIVQTFKYAILNGSYQPGSQLPSVRLIAKQENCNPATVHRAFKYLEQQGLIFIRRNSGAFVTDNMSKVDALRQQEYTKLTSDFFDRLHAFGYSDIEICELLQNHFSGEVGDRNNKMTVVAE